MKTLAAAIGSLFLLSAQPTHAEQAAGGNGAADDVSYGPYPIETMQVCVPAGPTVASRAATLVIHGGAWVSEDKKGTRFAAICGKLAESGIVAFNINYRLIRVADNTNAWPAQIQDVQLALRWVRAHAKQYNIDPKRVCALGTSAGGNLAALLGVQKSIVPRLKDEDPQGETALYPDQSPQASCVVDISGPTDLGSMVPPGSNPLAAMASQLVGKKTLAQALAQISPIGMVGEHTAPMLIVYGTADKAVPSATQALPFYQALKDKKVPAKLIEYTGHHALGMTAPAEVSRVLDAAASFINDPR